MKAKLLYFEQYSRDYRYPTARYKHEWCSVCTEEYKHWEKSRVQQRGLRSERKEI